MREESTTTASRKRGIEEVQLQNKKSTSFECYLARVVARKEKVKVLLASYNSQVTARENDVDIDRFMKIYDDETIPDMWCENQLKKRYMVVHPRTKRAIGIKIHALHEIVDNILLNPEDVTIRANDIFRRIAIMIRTSQAGEYDIIEYGHDSTQYEEGDDPALVGWINPPSTSNGGKKSTRKRNSKNKNSKRANKKRKLIQNQNVVISIKIYHKISLI